MRYFSLKIIGLSLSIGLLSFCNSKSVNSGVLSSDNADYTTPSGSSTTVNDQNGSPIAGGLIINGYGLVNPNASHTATETLTEEKSSSIGTLCKACSDLRQAVKHYQDQVKDNKKITPTLSVTLQAIFSLGFQFCVSVTLQQELTSAIDDQLDKFSHDSSGDSSIDDLTRDTEDLRDQLQAWFAVFDSFSKDKSILDKMSFLCPR